MKPNICIFLGNDIYSWLTCHDLIANGHKDFSFKVYLPSVKSSKKPIDDLYMQGIYERKILQEVVFPFIDEKNIVNATYSSIKKLSEKFDISFEQVDNINSIEFIAGLDRFDGLVSIRCYQKFSKEYMEMFQGKPIWNLHPGDLPKYRGVMTFYRAMLNKDKNYAVTLHEMDEFWDAGPILSKMYGELNYDKCFLHSMFTAGKASGSFLFNCLRKKFYDVGFNKEVQDEYKYWGFPSSDEIKLGKENGVRIYDHKEILNEYLNTFFVNSEPNIVQEFGRRFNEFVGGGFK